MTSPTSPPGPTRRFNPAILMMAAGITLIVVAVVLALNPALLSPGTTIPPRIGQALNSFTLRDLNGKSVSLSDYRGKIVLVNIWATWCPPCRSEMPTLQAYYEQNREKGFVVLGIDAGDDALEVKDFATSNHITFPLLLDPGTALIERMGIYDYPTSIIVGRDGIVKTLQIGIYTPAKLQSDLDPLLK